MGEPDTEKRPEIDSQPAEPPKPPSGSTPAEAKHPSAPAIEAAKAPSAPPIEAAAKAPSSPPLEAAKATSSPPLEAANATSAPPLEAAAPAKHPSSRPVEAAAPAVAERASTREPAAKAFPPAGRESVKTTHAGGPLGAYEAIARSARLPDLVAIAQKILGDAASARRAGWDFSTKVAAAADEAKLSRSDADTPFGNVLKVLGSGPEGQAERALAAGLWAHAIAEARRDDEERLAGDVLWLATHTAFDATSLLDRALGDEADDLWTSIGDRIRRIDEGRGTALGRGEAIVGCAALAASDSAAARRIATDLATRVGDPTLQRLLGGAAEAPMRELRLEGEAMAAPRGPVLTAILAFTGILFAMHALRFVARVALAYRRPAEVSLSEAGVRIKTRTELLGRTLREREHVIVRSGLVRVVREVRYPRAAFYAGLLALAIGSYVGVRAFVDGVRAASPSLLLTGLVVIALGIAADFVLGSLVPGSRGRVRITFVPRTGKTVCVGDVDALRADDALLRSLKSR
jgi:hypothetical protein